MWQVTYNPSVVDAPSSCSKAMIHKFKRRCWQTGVRKVAVVYQERRRSIVLSADGRILSNRCTESSRGIAGEKPEVLLSMQTGEYCQK